MDFEELETRSQISCSSQTSKLSVASTLALAFAKREAEMLKQQAILQANLHELRMEKAAAAAQAEAELLEAATEEYEQRSPLQQSKNIMLPQTPDEKYNMSPTVQDSVLHPGHLSGKSVILASALNTVTTSCPDAKQSTSSHSPVRQPTMDNGEAQNCRKQGDMLLSEISDYEFCELAPQLSHREGTTHRSHDVINITNTQGTPYRNRELPSTIDEHRPSQQYQTHSFPMPSHPAQQPQQT